MTFAEAMQKAATQYMRHLIAQSRGNMSHAAEQAGMHRSQIYKLCARLGIKIARKRPPSISSLPSFASWRMPRRPSP